MAENHERHSTRDLGEATYLFTLGFRIEGFDRRQKGVVHIVFSGDPEILRMKAMDYYEYKGQVDAKRFYDTQKELKRSIMRELDKE